MIRLPSKSVGKFGPNYDRPVQHCDMDMESQDRCVEFELASELYQFLQCRRKTIGVLSSISREVELTGKRVKSTNIASKATSALSGVGSLVLLGLVPVSGGATAAPSAALAGLSGVTATVSLSATLYKQLKEKGLLKKVNAVLDADRRAAERLKAFAGILQDLSQIAIDTANFLAQATKIGLQTAQEMQALLKLPEAARSTQIACRVAAISNKAIRVLRIAGPVLLVVSIPFDIMSVIADINDCKVQNYSVLSQTIIEKVILLNAELSNVRRLYNEMTRYDN